MNAADHVKNNITYILATRICFIQHTIQADPAIFRILDSKRAADAVSVKSMVLTKGEAEVEEAEKVPPVAVVVAKPVATNAVVAKASLHGLQNRNAALLAERARIMAIADAAAEESRLEWERATKTTAEQQAASFKKKLASEASQQDRASQEEAQRRKDENAKQVQDRMERAAKAAEERKRRQAEDAAKLKAAEESFKATQEKLRAQREAREAKEKQEKELASVRRRSYYRLHIHVRVGLLRPYLG